MPRIEPELQRLQEIKTLPSLIKYLKDDLNWPIESDDIENVTFDYDPAELGFDAASTAKIEEVRQLRPLTPGQKWGVFWVKFGKKQLPVQMLRRALGNLVVKKRASTKKSDKAAWHMHDLLFISAYGDDSSRHITFAHFSESEDSEKTLPVLKVLGWDDDDTVLHLKDTYKTLLTTLNWDTTPTNDPEAWREQWSSAFKLKHHEVINTTKELVVKLAQLATVIKKSVLTSIKAETEKGPWKKLMLAFRKTLIKDLDEDQFADVIAQTISYGLLTARLSSDGPINLKNLVDMVPSTNPFLKELLQHFLTSAGMKGLFDVDEAGINDVVELLNRANAQAIRNDFGKKTAGEDPVIHFYEHFLGEYNKKLKIERGVFYTPQPVVSYIVRSVHELLQKEFGLEDGLADTSTWADVKKWNKDLKIPEGINPEIEPFVQILDPATGTATFLIEVIDVIHNTMTKKWDKERITKADQTKKWNIYVPTHLLHRIYAYELMMAPYAIAHMKVGLKLTETGFTAWDKLGSENRANIYLTNALEPWTAQLDLPGFNALAHEAAAVNEVKRNKRFTVVIGNPPYSGISSNMSEQSQRIVDAYRYVDGSALNEKKVWLQDDYVKFTRRAQTIIDNTGVGICGQITNHGYIDNPTFRGMRQSLMATFPHLCLLDLHGNANKKEQSPDGSEDKNVFDIRQGVAIFLGTRSGKIKAVESFDLWGTRDHKYSWLTTHSISDTILSTLTPESPYYFFKPQNHENDPIYDAATPVDKIFSLANSGIVTARDGLVLDFDLPTLRARISEFVSSKSSDTEIQKKFDLSENYMWRVSDARKQLSSVKNRDSFYTEVLYRPFNTRRIFFHPSVVWRPRMDVMSHMLKRNLALITTRQTRDPFGALATRLIAGHKSVAGYDINSVFPLYTYPADGDERDLLSSDERVHNLEPIFLKKLASALNLSLDCNTSLPDGITPEDVFHYAYSVFHSPTYRTRYVEFLKIDFPRLPLTGKLKLFRTLTILGKELTELHIMEALKSSIKLPEFIGSQSSEIEKPTWSKNAVWIDNDATVGFTGVKEEIWSFQIGGYRVCEKWLKDRKGRKLAKEDIDCFKKIVTALSETIRLTAEIDKVIEEHGGWPGAFQTAK